MSINEETKTLVTFIRHVKLVQKHLNRLTSKLELRSLVHDLSKFTIDEFEGFVEFNRIAREYEYGSPEYNQSIKDNSDVIDLHYQNNSHHPQYHHGGVADMGLLDITEMVCDRKAASETYGQTDFNKSLSISIERFGLTPEQEYLVRLIARELE